MTPTEIEAFLQRLCDAASVETMARFRCNVDVSNKEAGSFDPVTEADRAAETAIRAIISETYSDHAIIGEEHGTENASASFSWIIDPVDGTRAFISGLPTWGTLIGLYENDKPLAGVMHQPFTSEMYYCDGETSYLKIGMGDRKPLRTRATSSLADAYVMTTSPRIFSKEDQNAYDRVEAECKLPRYGFDCYAYAMLASGQVDVVMEADLHIYDIAALIPIIERAGGIVTDWQGGDASRGGRVLAAANKALHAQLLDLIN